VRVNHLSNSANRLRHFIDREITDALAYPAATSIA